jgi:hypothetical protein
VSADHVLPPTTGFHNFQILGTIPMLENYVDLVVETLDDVLLHLREMSQNTRE